jgi:uncharacterized membrane protein
VSFFQLQPLITSLVSSIFFCLLIITDKQCW